MIPIGNHVSWLYFDKDFANARSIGSFNSLGYRKCIGLSMYIKGKFASPTNYKYIYVVSMYIALHPTQVP